MGNTLVNVTKRITELVTEDDKDYLVQLNVTSLLVRINTGKNKVGSIIFTTAPKSALKNGYMPLLLSNKVSARRIYSNWGEADDEKGFYHLAPNTKYILTIRSFPQYCFVDIQEYQLTKPEVYNNTHESSSSSSSS